MARVASAWGNPAFRGRCIRAAMGVDNVRGKEVWALKSRSLHCMRCRVVRPDGAEPSTARLDSGQAIEEALLPASCHHVEEAPEEAADG